MIVELREVTEEDLPILFAYQLDPVATDMAAFPARERNEFIAHWLKIMADETLVTMAVVVDGQVAGDIVGFDRLGVREVGYWIGRDFWGKGVATRALLAFLDHDRTRPLFARVATRNVASIRVLHKCGFTIADASEEPPDPLGDGVEETVLRLDAEPYTRPVDFAP
jgi:RimJ/RimL family protein N-acetyltransferase